MCFPSSKQKASSQEGAEAPVAHRTVCGGVAKSPRGSPSEFLGTAEREIFMRISVFYFFFFLKSIKVKIIFTSVRKYLCWLSGRVTQGSNQMDNFFVRVLLTWIDTLKSDLNLFLLFPSNTSK